MALDEVLDDTAGIPGIDHAQPHAAGQSPSAMEDSSRHVAASDETDWRLAHYLVSGPL